MILKASKILQKTSLCLGIPLSIGFAALSSQAAKAENPKELLVQPAEIQSSESDTKPSRMIGAGLIEGGLGYYALKNRVDVAKTLMGRERQDVLNAVAEYFIARTEIEPYERTVNELESLAKAVDAVPVPAGFNQTQTESFKIGVEEQLRTQRGPMTVTEADIERIKADVQSGKTSNASLQASNQRIDETMTRWQNMRNKLLSGASEEKKAALAVRREDVAKALARKPLKERIADARRLYAKKSGQRSEALLRSDQLVADRLVRVEKMTGEEILAAREQYRKQLAEAGLSDISYKDKKAIGRVLRRGVTPKMLPFYFAGGYMMSEGLYKMISTEPSTLGRLPLAARILQGSESGSSDDKAAEEKVIVENNAGDSEAAGSIQNVEVDQNH